MKENNTNKDFELPEVLKQQKGKNAFDTPDNYFDNLSNSLNNIPSVHPVSPLQSFIKTATFKYIAAAVISAAVITGAIIINKSKLKDNNQGKIEIVDNTEKEIKVNDNQSKLINTQEESKEVYSDNSIIELPKKSQNLSSDKKTIEKVNNSINDSKSKSEVDLNNKDATENKPPEHKQEILTDNSGNIQINDNSQVTQSSQIPLNKQSNTTVVQDSCVLDSCILTPNVRFKKQKYFYKWSTGDMKPEITVYESGKYWVQISTERTFENSYTDTFNIKIIPSPEIDLGKDRIICKFESIKLKSNVKHNAYSYLWNINGSKQSSITLQDLDEGVYNISLSIKACNQTFNDQLILNVNNCSLNIPNVITPNNDGVNDYFTIEGLEHYSNVTLIIIDRSGKQVYQSSNYQNNWNGDNIPEGTYYYVLRLKEKEYIEKGGIITIIRK